MFYDPDDLEPDLADAKSNGEGDGYRGARRRTYEHPAVQAAYDDGYTDGHIVQQDEAEGQEDAERWGTWEQQHARGAWNTL